MSNARKWTYDEPIQPAGNPEDVRLLNRAKGCLSDMIRYHNCDHAHLDVCCCVCESKLVLRAIEDRQRETGGLIG